MTHAVAVDLLHFQRRRRVLPTGLAPGGDISNHQAHNYLAVLDAHPEWEYVVLRSQAPGEPAHFRQITVQQAIAVLARGMLWDPYDWGYLVASPEVTAANTAALALGNRTHGIQYLDCETYERDGVLIDPGPINPQWIWRWIAEVEQYRMTPAIYTGRWWIMKHFEGGEPAFAQFADRCLLWLSNYNPHWYTFETVPLPVGWDRSQFIGWQYVGSPIDLNWWDRRLLARHRRVA